MAKILRVENLSKTYENGSKKLVILDKINFDIEEGETFAIVGPSGSGKTTLLGLSAGLDRIDDGTVDLCGQNLSELDEDGRAELRNRHVGFVFQNFQLIPTLTALENVAVPLELRGDSSAENEATALLEKVGLQDRMHHYPTQLSGGEQQRVALARAFCNKPKILFADEPTGNLDEATGKNVVDLLLSLNKDLGTTLVIVTHDLELAKKTQRILKLRGGKVQKLQNQQ